MDEPQEAEVRELGRINAPWNKEITAQAVHYPSGLRLARLRIREGRRFTVLDVDGPTAQWLTTVFREALDNGAPRSE